MSTLHPDHADRIRTVGHLLHLPVQTITLDMADHPEQAHQGLALNSSQAWARWGDGAWVQTNRVSRNLPLLSVEWSAEDAAEVWGEVVGGQGWIPVAKEDCVDRGHRWQAERDWCVAYATGVLG